MYVIVRVAATGPDRPPVGAPIMVEARDTTFEDAAAPTIASAEGSVRGRQGPWLDTVELTLPSSLPSSSIVWVHIDVDGDERVSPGDYITMQSYPIPSQDGAEVEVAVRRV